MSENEIQNSILEWLYFVDITAWRNNSGAVFSQKDNTFRRKSKYDKNGISDILGILPDGRFLAIEVKKNKSCKPSKTQKDFINDIRRDGGIAICVWSVEQVKKALKEYY